MNPNEKTTNATPPPPAKTERKPEIEISELLAAIVDDAVKKQVLEQEIRRRDFNHKYRVAEALAAAGYFDAGGDGEARAKMTEYQAFAKILVGESWGLNEADSIRFVYIVNGKPALENEIYAAKMQDAGWSWKIQFLGTEAECKGCRLFIYRDGKPYMQEARDAAGNLQLNSKGEVVMEQVKVSFTEETAKGVIIYQKGQRVPLLQKYGPWSDGYRQDMYYWRCISRLKKYHCPNVLRGAALRDELTDISELEVSNHPPGRRDDAPPEDVKQGTKEDQKAVAERRIEELKKAQPQSTDKPATETKDPDPPLQANDAPKEQAKSSRPAHVIQIASMIEVLGDVGYRILGDSGFERPEQVTVLAAKDVIADLEKAVRSLKKESK